MSDVFYRTIFKERKEERAMQKNTINAIFITIIALALVAGCQTTGTSINRGNISPSASKYLDAANHALGAGQYNQALRHTETALKYNLTSNAQAEAYHIRGLSYSRLGHYQEALADLDKASARIPKAKADLASLLLRVPVKELKDPARSLELSTSLLKGGLDFSLQKEVEKAWFRAYPEAMSVALAGSDYALVLSMTRFGLGKGILSETDPGVLGYRGIAQARSGNPGKALPDLEAARKARPQDKRVAIELARVLVDPENKGRDVPRAIQLAKVAGGDSVAEVYQAAREQAAKAGDYARAIELATDAISSGQLGKKEEATALQDKAGYWRAMGQPRQALDDYNRAISGMRSGKGFTPEDRAMALVGKGDCLIGMGDVLNGLMAYQAAIMEEPGYSPAYLKAAQHLMGQDAVSLEDAELAVQYSEKAFSLDSNAETYDLLARALATKISVQARSGNLGGALQTFGDVQGIVRVHGQLPDETAQLMYMTLGDSMYLNQRYREAAAYYSKVLEINPENKLALNNRSWVRSAAPDPAARNPKGALRDAMNLNQLDDQDYNYQETLVNALLRDDNNMGRKIGEELLKRMGQDGSIQASHFTKYKKRWDAYYSQSIPYTEPQ